MIRTQIQLTEEQVKTLKKTANKKQVSLAELIRQRVALMRLSGEVPIEERKKRAIVATGRFHLVDCTSFAIMRKLCIKKVFAYDPHFKEQGFVPV